MKKNPLLVLVLSCLLGSAFPAWAQKVPAKLLKMKMPDFKVKTALIPIGKIELRLPKLSTARTMSPLHYQEAMSNWHTKYQTSLTTLEKARAAARPIDLEASTYRVREQRAAAEAKTSALHAHQELMFQWGEFQHDSAKLGYSPLPYLEVGTKGFPILNVNGYKIFIDAQIFDEVFANAETLKAVLDVHRQHILNYTWENNPQQASAFVYLDQSFQQAYDIMEEVLSGRPMPEYSTLKRIKNWWNGEDFVSMEDMKLIQRDLNFAYANMALSTVEMLKFISIHPEAFPSAIETYKEIMRLKMKTPGQIERSWEGPVSI